MMKLELVLINIWLDSESLILCKGNMSPGAVNIKEQFTENLTVLQSESHDVRLL